MANRPLEETKAYCNKCCDQRKHDLLHKEKVKWEDPIDAEMSVFGGDIYEMVKCRGCDAVAMRHQSWCDEEVDVHGDPIVTTTSYPPATFRKEPRWFSQLMTVLPTDDQTVHDLLKEVYSALRNRSLRLAVMGIRAILEHVMIDKVGDNRTFQKNLDEFEKQGFVSKAQRRVLEPVLEAGHATMHRAFRPSRNDLVALMDVTENIIESTYINELRAAKLSKRVPKRKKRAGSGHTARKS